MRTVEIDFKIEFIGEWKAITIVVPLDKNHVYNDKVLDSWFNEFANEYGELEPFKNVDFNDEDAVQDIVNNFESHDALQDSIYDALVFSNSRIEEVSGRDHFMVDVSLSINGEDFKSNDKKDVEYSFYPIPDPNDAQASKNFWVDAYLDDPHYFDVNVVAARLVSE